MRKEDVIFDKLKMVGAVLDPAPTKEKLTAFTIHLKDHIHDLNRFSVAISEIIQKEKFFPAPVTILEYYRKDDTKNKIDLIMKAVSRFGSYQYQEARAYLGEDVYGAVTAAGGWVKLCESTDYDRERFLEPKMKEYFKELPSKQLLVVDSKQ